MGCEDGCDGSLGVWEFVTLCHLRGNNLMRSTVVPCHVLIVL